MKRNSVTSPLLRRLNRSAVLNLIRRADVVSPSLIATKLNLSLPTITRVIEGLLEEDLVEYDGFGKSTGGRRPAYIKFKGSSYAVIGLDLGGRQFFGAVSDLNGRIQAERHADADPRDGNENLERLVRLIKELLEAKRPADQRVRGIGVGVPSIVRVPEGHVEWAQKLGWRDLPLRRVLSERLDVPIFVENDVNLAAVGEAGFGAGQGADCSLCLVVGAGTGAGIIIKGTLFRGHSYAAGELGWFLHDETLCGRRFPRLGKLEDLRRGPGIRHRVIRVLEMVDQRYLEGRFDLNSLGDPTLVKKSPSLQLVNEVLDYFTLAIASACSAINPQMIILAGDFSPHARMLADVLRERLRGRLPFVPKIIISGLGHRAVAMGAIMTVLDATTLNGTGTSDP